MRTCSRSHRPEAADNLVVPNDKIVCGWPGEHLRVLRYHDTAVTSRTDFIACNSDALGAADPDAASEWNFLNDIVFDTGACTAVACICKGHTEVWSECG